MARTVMRQRWAAVLSSTRERHAVEPRDRRNLRPRSDVDDDVARLVTFAVHFDLRGPTKRAWPRTTRKRSPASRSRRSTPSRHLWTSASFRATTAARSTVTPSTRTPSRPAPRATCGGARARHHRFGGGTAVVRARAAEARTLDQEDRAFRRGEPGGEGHAGLTTADHDDVRFHTKKLRRETVQRMQKSDV